ncbi:porin family protein [Pontibacter russatus]|uniref:porin family protein n=1 Tax=Pontibacter russatus TaxID=2694929 RepID=UPI00137A42A8|nr:porin family protein [Pontibacter russatus]
MNASDEKNTFGFKFKNSAGGNQDREYKPGEVKEVIYGNEKYVSAFIPDPAFNQAVFLKMLIESEVNLYKAVDTNGKAHFFFQEAGGELQLLQEKTYSGLLKVHLRGCATMNFDDPSFVKKYGYSATGLSKFFIAYNTCASPGAPIIEHKNKTELYITKGVTAGMASTSVSLTTIVAKPGSYGTYVNMNAGVFGELHIGRHLSTLLELQYHSYKGGLYEPDAFYPDEIEIEMQYVRVPLLLKYTTSGKVRLFANAGPHADVLIGQSGRRNYSKIESDYHPDFARLSYGLTGGAGVALAPFSKTTALKLEGRYSKTTLNTGVNPCGTLASYQLLVGFSF